MSKAHSFGVAPDTGQADQVQATVNGEQRPEPPGSSFPIFRSDTSLSASKQDMSRL